MLFKKVSADEELDLTQNSDAEVDLEQSNDAEVTLEQDSIEEFEQSNVRTGKPYNWDKFFAVIRKDALAWLLIAPSLIFFIIFLWHPIVMGVRLSFYKTHMFDAVKYVGLKNFKYIMSNSEFKTTLMNTLKYTFWSLSVGLFLPIITAIILNEMTFMKSFFRMAVYFPCLVPGIVTSLMWKIMLEPGRDGLFNAILAQFGHAPLEWLQNPDWTIPLIIISGTWGGFGSTTILYLADLQSVNVDLYEASSLDGAGFLQRVWHITLPHMWGLIKMLLVMQIIGVFQIFQQPLAMTGGGPNKASKSLMMQSYDYGFVQMNMGRSTAVSVFTMVLLIIFTILYLKLSKSSEAE